MKRKSNSIIVATAYIIVIIRNGAFIKEKSIIVPVPTKGIPVTIVEAISTTKIMIAVALIRYRIASKTTSLPLLTSVDINPMII